MTPKNNFQRRSRKIVYRDSDSTFNLRSCFPKYGWKIFIGKVLHEKVWEPWYKNGPEQGQKMLPEPYRIKF